MKLTKEKLESIRHIPTHEVEQDLKDAKSELEIYEKQKELLPINLQNKVQLYMLDGKILKGHEFIDELNQILEYRKILNQPIGEQP